MSYLVRQSHSWCFRLVIPPDLRAVVGKYELRYTLYVGSKKKAKKLSNRIARKVKPLLADLRSNQMSLSQEQIEKIVRNHVREVLEEMVESNASQRAARGRPLTPDELDKDIFGRTGLISTLELMESEYKENLARQDYSSVASVVDGIIKGNSLPIKKDSEDYFRLCHDILSVNIKLTEAQHRRLRSDDSVFEELRKFSSEPAAQPSAVPEHPATSLSQLTDEYWKVRSPNWGVSLPLTITGTETTCLIGSAYGRKGGGSDEGGSSEGLP